MLLSIIYVITITTQAITGALSAKKRSMDLFGVMLIAFVSAFGGGSTRDVLLGHYPMVWVKQTDYLIITSFAAVLTVVLFPVVDRFKHLFLVLDAFGLIAFTIIGCDVALSMHSNFLVSCVFGVITGVFGGILRDLLSNETPLIFQKELYASISLGSAVCYLMCLYFNLAQELSILITLFGGFFFRIIVIKNSIKRRN